jgi:hypothetical protein
VADGIIFEKLGVQTATLVTDAFTASGNAMARRMGMPGYHYAMLPHPVANLTPEECKERACELLPEILEILGVEAKPELISDRQRASAAEQVAWPGGGSV